MLKEALQALLAGQSLSEEQMAEAIGLIMDGTAHPALVGAFLVALRVNGETVPEITGAARAMRQRMTPIHSQKTVLVDTCGTGGSGTGAFNISTAVAFVVASAGVGVAKHGNRAVSSQSGSADVLAACGVNIEASHATVEHCLNTLGVGFLFAQTCHPAMRHAAPIRKELGIRTIFNVLGPLTNPAGAKRQLLGVFSAHLLSPLAAVLGRLGSERAFVVHGADGLDELTVCGPSSMVEWTGTNLVEHTVRPEDVGLKTYPEGSLRGSGPEENAKLLQAILAGEHKGAIADAVAFNAGAALTVAGASPTLAKGVVRAQELLDSGDPAKLLQQLARLSFEPA